MLGYDSVFSDDGTFLYTLPVAGYPPGSVDQWYTDNADNLANWHSQVEEWTNTGYANLADVAIDPVGHIVPGTQDFDALFNQLTSTKIMKGREVQSSTI